MDAGDERCESCGETGNACGCGYEWDEYDEEDAADEQQQFELDEREEN